MKYTTFFAIASLWAAPGFCKPESKEHISVSKVAPVTLSKKTPVGLMVEVKVDAGFHIQANPASAPSLIATTIELPTEKEKWLSAGQPIYPAGKPYRLPGSTYDVSTYSDTFKIEVPVNATADAKPGKKNVTAKLRYQACNDKICFPPITTSVPVAMTITEGK